MELEIHPGVGFSNSTRLAMFKSLSKPDFNKIARSTACTCYYYFVPEIWRGAKILKADHVTPSDPL